ncbi:MAG: hypothetical protein M3394_10445 [Actinomycetota bacterium]|nr:hypothetical protein [Actinomycetota bacterium]
MRRSRLLLLAFVAVAAMVWSRGVTYSAFSHSGSGSSNRFAAGTVNVGDNDANETMLRLTNAQPGAADTGCIRVSYTGTLPSTLRLYATTSGAMAAHLQLTVTRGVDTTPQFDTCEGFVPDTPDYLGQGQGVVYKGTLAAFPSAWGSAPADPPSGAVESWATGEVHSYRLSVTLGNDVAAKGTTASASFSWEARNQ